MSAISVAWTQTDDPPARVLQGSMAAAQSMYGANRRFSWSDEHIAPGGSLSNILPEDRFDTQPIWSTDGRSCLVADVRLDNRADLARSLDLVHPEELADSSILMAAWIRWGPSCLDHIAGGFAFAVWAPDRQELFAARDHAGERPLFYHRGKHLFALASMPKGLLVLPGVLGGFEEAQLADWLACVPLDWTKSCFAGVERVPPGHLLRITPDSFECTQYWHPANAKPTRYTKDEDYAEALIEIFDRATNARLRTTKSIGSFLSAGLDCSSVTASAARLLGAQGKNLTAFTSVPRPDFNNISQSWLLSNEGPAASEVARLYPNIQHVLVDSTGYDLVATMKLWTDAADEPPLNVVNLLWFMGILERAKQRGIDVMLQGASGNGTISWETWGILGSFFRRGRWIKLLTTIRSLRNHGDISLKAAVRSSVGGVLPAWFNHKLIPAASLREIFSSLAHPELIRKHALSAKIFKNTFDESPDLIAEHTRFFDLVDPGPINAAAQGIAGIEFRDPTADKRVYDFCFSIPPEQYVASGHSRSLVRRAMKGRLPESTLQRYTRGRQSADWYLSMKEALPRLREEMSSLGQSPAVQQTVDLPRLQGLLDTWPESGYEEKQVYGPWHVALSRAFSMASFLRNYDSAANAVTLLIEPPTQDQPAVPVPPVAAPLN